MTERQRWVRRGSGWDGFYCGGVRIDIVVLRNGYFFEKLESCFLFDQLFYFQCLFRRNKSKWFQQFICYCLKLELILMFMIRCVRGGWGIVGGMIRLYSYVGFQGNFVELCYDFDQKVCRLMVLLIGVFGKCSLIGRGSRLVVVWDVRL